MTSWVLGAPMARALTPVTASDHMCYAGASVRCTCYHVMTLQTYVCSVVTLDPSGSRPTPAQQCNMSRMRRAVASGHPKLARNELYALLEQMGAVAQRPVTSAGVYHASSFLVCLNVIVRHKHPGATLISSSRTARQLRD
jgi:hypothetical protein